MVTNGYHGLRKLGMGRGEDVKNGALACKKMTIQHL